MIDSTDTSMSKQMAALNQLLNLVGTELFATLDHSERCLEMFISERQSYNSLQQFIHALHQIRGTLTLIEIIGAAELAETMLQCANDIPTGADKSWDDRLSALSTAIFILRHYLENITTYPAMLSELLIPTINELRQSIDVPPLPDSYFSNISVKSSGLPFTLATEVDYALFSRLRQMYQIGLLDLIKDKNKEACLRMMSRAMERLQHDLTNEDAACLCWVTAAALEAFKNSKMTAYNSRKRLFSRVDQQLRKTQINNEKLDYALLKDLLYLISLENQENTKTEPVIKAFNLIKSPINNQILEAEINKLAGPNHNVICSFTAAIREELNHTQATIDTFSLQKTNHAELVDNLIININQLIKTLALEGLQQAETMLREQIGILKIHQTEEVIDPVILDRLADVILHVESYIIDFENNSCVSDKFPAKTTPEVNGEVSSHYLIQGMNLAVKGALTGLGFVQQCITGYVESDGDKQYLEKILGSFDEIYGSLLFLNQERAASIIRACQNYIETKMILTDHVPNSYELDNLADILTSLEFFMETNTTGTIDNKVLDLAEESLLALQIPSSQKLAEIIEPPILNERVIEEPVITADVPEETLADSLSSETTSKTFDNLTLAVPPLRTTTAEEEKPAKSKEKVKKVVIPTVEEEVEEENVASEYKDWTLL